VRQAETPLMAGSGAGLPREVLPVPGRGAAVPPALDAKDPGASVPPIEPPTGVPNVLVVLLDDVGFGASTSFGGRLYCAPEFPLSIGQRAQYPLCLVDKVGREEALASRTSMPTRRSALQSSATQALTPGGVAALVVVWPPGTSWSVRWI
jgi:hypothetical protein